MAPTDNITLGTEKYYRTKAVHAILNWELFVAGEREGFDEFLNFVMDAFEVCVV